MKTILITGGAGFIGSNFIRYFIHQYADFRVLNVDKLTYAGNLENLKDVQEHFPERYIFFKADISIREEIEKIFSEFTPNYVINFAAESHVDRSIYDASPFILSNVLGTQVLLDLSGKYGITRFLQISTDEVYGSLGTSGYFTELTPLAPNSPYSASKAGADCLVRAAFKTHGMDTVITRCSNNYGPFQFPEKLIPLMITNALEDRSLPVYGDGQNVRDWIHVMDHCHAIDTVLFKGKAGEVYNVGGNSELPNIEIVKLILKILNKPESLISFVKDRPGHDRRYAIDFSKIKTELEWEPRVKLEDGLRATINWYRQNKKWWRRIKSGEYRDYYEKHYKMEYGE